MNTPNTPNGQQPAQPPQVGEQDFDRKLALAVFAQNERRIEAEKAVEQTNKGVMQAIIGVQTAPATWAAPTRAELVWQYLLHQPHIVGLTEMPAVDAAIRVVDAYLARFPRT